MIDRQIDQNKYEKDFPKRKQRVALRQALDIRKFEIDLYWKRADYFWKFIGATLAGYFVIATTKSDIIAQDYLVLLACLGLVLSYGWFCANKGSKQWQENWENHVDMLEDDIVGPLYKTILLRTEPLENEKFKEWLTGPGPFSVSKINQIISLLMTLIWAFLLYNALNLFSWEMEFSKKYLLCVSVALLSCWSFHKYGKTYFHDHEHRAIQRVTTISDV